MNTNLMKIFGELSKNVDYIKKHLVSDDVKYMDFTVSKHRAVLIFIKDVVDLNMIGELVLRPILGFDKKFNRKNLENIFISPEKRISDDLSQIIDSIVDGHCALLIEKIDACFIFNIRNNEKRAITEPPTSTVIKGPREGFIESLPVNINLMRKRIKSSALIIENLSTGKFSKTEIALLYIKGLADKKLVKALKNKISSINIDAVLDSSYISKFLGNHRASLFKQVGNTEKPDILTARLLEGRVAIMVDGSPIVLTVPYLLIEDFQSPSDYYNSNYNATLSRFLRLFAVFFSLILPAFYVSAELFHLQLIPLPFLLTIVNSIKGLPLSPSYEMFFTLFIFDILNEASVRMPKYVGMVISIVGGLVLGETAVNAGIISAPTLMIIAFSGICLYTVPELEQSFSLLRIIYLIIGGSVGGYALLVAIAFTLVYVITFENYSTPLFAPFSPLIKKDLKDSFIKGFLIEQHTRPQSLVNRNKVRLNDKVNK